ncbi:hypothetical protein [Asticcacaulis sp. MM231]|uniref:hypothetical protein n=1 Tax=Asticcacaulis sp. MM231 TaxID=3157666 RepID=UPI0032D5988A
MAPDILEDVQARLESDFGFKTKGAWMQQGRCPSCKKRELFTRRDNPWVVRCGRSNRCGYEIDVKDEYRDLFESWSNSISADRARPERLSRRLYDL